MITVPFKATPKAALPVGPILVAGLGRAGQAALARLTAERPPHSIQAWDANTSKIMQARAAEWKRRGVQVELGGDGGALLSSGAAVQMIVKSPGIDLDAPLLRAARSKGVDVIDELEIGWRLCRTPVIAVTGTNGKSTTCAVIAAILQAAGQPSHVVGNTEFGPPLSATRPDAAVVCEVSSFQLEAAPTFRPEVAVFTNLSMEHLSRHGSMDAYGRIKQRMFAANGLTCGVAVVNGDDPWGQHILTTVRQAGGRCLSFGGSPAADVRVIEARWTTRDAHTRLAIDNQTIDLQSRLPGQHNALNIAAAVGAGLAAGLPLDAIAAGVATADPPPGRCWFINEGQPFTVVVDYAHTPDGIAQFLSAMRTITLSRGTTLHTVFGAVGLPDPAKAAGCAKAARQTSDQLILTTGSAPRSSRILRLGELRDASRKIGPVTLVLDRRRAIARALRAAAPGDIVAILGLGALRYQVLDARGTYVPFQDGAVAAAVLREHGQ